MVLSTWTGWRVASRWRGQQGLHGHVSWHSGVEGRCRLSLFLPLREVVQPSTTSERLRRARKHA